MRGVGTTAKGSAAGIGTKVCPRCGEELFEDMNICYGCLFDFDHEPEVPQIAQVDGLGEDSPGTGGCPRSRRSAAWRTPRCLWPR